MINPKDARLFGGVPLDAINQQPTGGQVVRMQQPDGSMVVVPIEVATLHVLAEIRTELQRARLIREMQTTASILEEVDRRMAANEGGNTDGAHEE